MYGGRCVIEANPPHSSVGKSYIGGPPPQWTSQMNGAPFNIPFTPQIRSEGNITARTCQQGVPNHLQNVLYSTPGVSPPSLSQPQVVVFHYHHYYIPRGSPPKQLTPLLEETSSKAKPVKKTSSQIETNGKGEKPSWNDLFGDEEIPRKIKKRKKRKTSSVEELKYFSKKPQEDAPILCSPLESKMNESSYMWQGYRPPNPLDPVFRTEG